MRDFRLTAESLRDELIAWRRDFHQHPELAFQEVRTANIVARELESLGMEVQSGIGKTGVIGILDGDSDGPTVMVRCDMDALPIQEENPVEYASQTPQTMHACGHDGHTAIALGVARLLNQHKSRIQGRVKFIFQPAEETGFGARAMITDGALDNPHPDVFLGLHLWTDLPIGEVAVPHGPSMAGADTFTVTINGRGSHAALPHLAADPVMCMVQTISALQTIVSRNLDPLETAVVSVTQLTGSHAVNIIPDVVTFAGTLRTFRPATRERALGRIKEIAGATASAFGCQASVEFEQLSLPVINDTEIASRITARIASAMPDLVLHSQFRVMAAEDVAFFLDRVPGVFMMIGAANAARGLDYPHHHPHFDFDEQALVTSVAVLASAISEYVIPT